MNGRQSTPDIIRDNNTKRPQPQQEKADEAEKEAAEEKEESPGKEASPVPVSKEATPEVAPASKEGSQEVEEVPNNEEVRERKIITSEEEAKVRSLVHYSSQPHINMFSCRRESLKSVVK